MLKNNNIKDFIKKKNPPIVTYIIKRSKKLEKQGLEPTFKPSFKNNKKTGQQKPVSKSIKLI